MKHPSIDLVVLSIAIRVVIAVAIRAFNYLHRSDLI